jgi:tetratricopeptide (TPR) repeat protein
MLRVLSLLFLGGTVLAAQQPAAQHEHPAPAEEKLGRVHFATSCRPEAAASFDRAVALLHSFSFSAARKAFEGVLTTDPACAMAHWGIAMTNWGNPFASMRSPKALADGLAAVQRAQKTGQPTPRERAYIDAVATLFKDHATVDQRTRVLAYERAMEQVSAAHPDDSEAAAFYALAVNQTALPSDKTYANQLKAAGILEKLFAQQPEHPGLTHYIIHAYDHPPLAPKALDAARRYAKIAPSAPHALHMPSHTFTRVGSWQESIDTNIESAKAAVRDGTLGEALHAMDYQVYAYLQTGQDAAARRLVDETPRIVEKLDPGAIGGAAAGFAGLYAAAAIPARYTMERSDWAAAAALQPRKTAYHWVDAVTRFARAVGAARTGNLEAARADLEELRRHAQEVKASGDTYWAEQVNIQISVAAAWISFAEGRKEDAERRLRAAADAEDATDKSAISPGPLAPAREFLGEMLLALGRPADALKEFQATLRKEPNRFRATYYAARAAGLAGNRQASREYYRQLAEICQRGDTPGRPELQQARRARTS